MPFRKKCRGGASYSRRARITARSALGLVCAGPARVGGQPGRALGGVAARLWIDCCALRLRVPGGDRALAARSYGVRVEASDRAPFHDVRAPQRQEPSCLTPDAGGRAWDPRAVRLASPQPSGHPTSRCSRRPTRIINRGLAVARRPRLSAIEGWRWRVVRGSARVTAGRPPRLTAPESAQGRIGPPERGPHRSIPTKPYGRSAMPKRVISFVSP